VRTLLGILVGLLLLVLVAAVVAGPEIARFLPSFKTEETGTEVRSEPAAIGTLVETVSAPGEIVPNLKVEISAEVSARIMELPFREGDRVKKGDVVVRLDDRDFNAALESSKARRDAERFRLEAERSRIAGPESALANARTTLERQRKLFETGDVPRQTLDDAEARVRDLEASVAATRHAISVIESSLAAAEADIRQAEEALGRTVIASPMDGMLTQLNAEVGELVVVGTMNNAGTVILTVGDLSKVKLNAEMNEADIARVERDQKAEIRINAYKDEVFPGRVRQVALQRTQQLDGTGFFKVEVDVLPPEDGSTRQILSGLAANVDIEIEAHEGLKVPSQAILDAPVDELPEAIRTGSPLVDRTRRTATVVYRIKDGKAVVTPVRTGPSSLSETLVIAGLEPGDEVVTGPYKVLEKLKDGEKVRKETAKSGSGGEAAPAGEGEAEVSVTIG
jgi:HlyD family secretion protein